MSRSADGLIFTLVYTGWMELSCWLDERNEPRTAARQTSSFWKKMLRRSKIIPMNISQLDCAA